MLSVAEKLLFKLLFFRFSFGLFPSAIVPSEIFSLGLLFLAIFPRPFFHGHYILDSCAIIVARSSRTNESILIILNTIIIIWDEYKKYD